MLEKQLKSLIENDQYQITTLANMSAFVYNSLEDVSWVGFYLYKDEQLILGPFQGKVACTKIQMGKGVCGTSAQRKETVIVENVHEFPGHIACDSATNSEIVIPVMVNGSLFGVFDLDSISFDRFKRDQEILEKMVHVLEEQLAHEIL